MRAAAHFQALESGSLDHGGNGREDRESDRRKDSAVAGAAGFVGSGEFGGGRMTRSIPTPPRRAPSVHGPYRGPGEGHRDPDRQNNPHGHGALR